MPGAQVQAFQSFEMSDPELRLSPDDRRLTPAGSIMPLGELVHVESTVGAGGLRRVDGHRTLGLNVSPPKDLSLGQAVEQL